MPNLKLNYFATQSHRHSQVAMPPKFLAYLIILNFDQWCPKQNTVAHLKSNILALSNFLAP